MNIKIHRKESLRLANGEQLILMIKELPTGEFEVSLKTAKNNSTINVNKRFTNKAETLMFTEYIRSECRASKKGIQASGYQTYANYMLDSNRGIHMERIQDIRNMDGRLVGRYYPDTATLEILVKDCLTSICFLPNREIEVSHIKCQK